MNIRNNFLVLSMISSLGLIGCTGTSSLGNQSIGQSVTQVLNGVQNGVNESINTLNASINTLNSSINSSFNVQKSSTLPKEDMVYLFGWLEDSCIGDTSPYDDFSKSTTIFNESFVGYNRESDTFFVKPREQWMPKYQNIIKSIKTEDNSEYRVYTVIFKQGVKYRNLPLSEYKYMFRPESEGSEILLKFASNADVKTIWSHFKSRQVKSWYEEGMMTMGARYSQSKNTVNCFLN